MMISHSYSDTVYVADYTRYNQDQHDEESPCSGVYFSTSKPPLIPSFVLENPHEHPFETVNFEENSSLLKRSDGTLRTQCEGLLYAHRDESPAWALFLELKYCEPKAIYDNTLSAMAQLKETCKYIMEEKGLLDNEKYKRYFVVSTPNAEPLDPFDANYFDQDDMLRYKYECNAIVFFSNSVRVHTPVHLKLG